MKWLSKYFDGCWNFLMCFSSFNKFGMSYFLLCYFFFSEGVIVFIEVTAS